MEGGDPEILFASRNIFSIVQIFFFLKSFSGSVQCSLFSLECYKICKMLLGIWFLQIYMHFTK